MAKSQKKEGQALRQELQSATQEKKLDIIIKEKKEKYPFNKIFIAVIALLAISAIIWYGGEKTPTGNAIIETEKASSAEAAQPQQDQKATAETTAPQPQATPASTIPVDNEVTEIVGAKKSCTIEEAQALIKNNLESETSTAYIVSYIQNFETQSYIPMYRKEVCKIYAPTKQQFQAFIRNRDYYELSLSRSLVFVDYGANIKSEEEYYSLIMTPKIKTIISGLQVVEPQGSHINYYFNSSSVVKP